ncbi:MAG: response regulator transcription factor, partial [Hymenobacteraceae bacterium]|nr:response regulator transcription factor [Hymenobacteraceae bacterium]
LDLNMPGKDGFELTKYIRQHHAGVKVLVLSMLEHERYVHQAIAEGASGYLLKNAGKEELSSAIKLVATGTPYICSNFTIDLLKKTHAPEGHAEQQAAQQPERRELTKRELEVLNLIGQGYTNAEIAEKLFTSKRTVETHRQNLLEKTHTKNTATLIKYAIQNGIIS